MAHPTSGRPSHKTWIDPQKQQTTPCERGFVLSEIGQNRQPTNICNAPVLTLLPTLTELRPIK